MAHFLENVKFCCHSVIW